MAIYRNRIGRSPLGNMGLQLLETQEKLVSQEYEIENLRIKAAEREYKECKVNKSFFGRLEEYYI